MLGISRWTDKGGSYRTVQRFFQTAIPWAQVMWAFFCTYLQRVEDVYLLVGDESVVTKSGKLTHGLDRFFSSIFGKPVLSVALFALSLVNTRERRAYPVMVEQVVRTETEKAAAKAKGQQQKTKKESKRKKAGRPKGSKNRNKSEVTLTPELARIQAMIQQFLTLVGSTITLSTSPWMDTLVTIMRCKWCGSVVFILFRNCVLMRRCISRMKVITSESMVTKSTQLHSRPAFRGQPSSMVFAPISTRRRCTTKSWPNRLMWSSS